MAAAETVELISSCRGKQKAKLGKWTYTMDKRVNDRFHWRCDVRACRGRLTTDLYDGRHMLFRSKPHCPETHRRYRTRGMVPPLEVQRIQSLEAVLPDKEKPTEEKPLKERARIGDYVYVLEQVRGEQHFWRCERRSCTGRCRSLNGVMIAGPSDHAHEPSAEGGQQVDTTPVVEASLLTATSAASWNSDEPEEYISIEPNVVIEDGVEENNPQATQNVSRASSVQPKEKSARSEHQWHPPPPPLKIGGKASSAAQRYAIVTSSGGGHVAAPLGTDSTSIRIKSVQGNADIGSNDGPLTISLAPGAGADSQAVKVNANNTSDAAMYWEDIGKQEDGTESAKRHWTDGSRHKRNRLDVLEVSSLGGPSSNMDARERELRLDVLLQTRRLLEAETELLIQQRKTEEIRQKLLRRQLQSMVGSDPQG